MFMHSGVKFQENEILLGRLHEFSADDPEDSVDWALISMDDKGYWKANVVDIPVGLTSQRTSIKRILLNNNGPRNIKILAITSSSGPVKEVMYGTPYFLRLRGSKAFQKTWTVCLDSKAGQSIIGMSSESPSLS